MTVAVWLVLGLAFLQPAVAAPQEDPAPQDEPAVQTDDADDTAVVEEEEQRGIPIGLYVEVGTGSTSFDPLDVTTRSSVVQSSLNEMRFDDVDYYRTAIGWRLPNEKGTFRLTWQGFKENGYELIASGRLSEVDPTLGVANAVVENLTWWNLQVVDGELTSTRTPPQWSLADDANMDGAVQRDEVTYLAPDITITSDYASDLENRLQVADLVYGRDWGPRKFRGRWTAGMRYFAYEGTLLQGAWLRRPEFGEGYTDGVLLRLLTPHQKSSGLGPTGSLGFNWNLFDERLQVFSNYSISFLLASVEVDTGEFVTHTPLSGSVGGTSGLVQVPGRLQADRSRTNWHTHADVGLRINLKMGLSLEMAYSIDGFLDSVITPTNIRVPQTEQEADQGTSALFATQDIVVDGWRAGVAFQF